MAADERGAGVEPELVMERVTRLEGAAVVTASAGPARERGRSAYSAVVAFGTSLSISNSSDDVSDGSREETDCWRLLWNVASVVVTTLPSDGTKMRHPFCLETACP